MKLIAALLGAILLYELQRRLYRRYWNKDLTVALQLSDDKAFEGDSLTLIETITNQKLLPIPVLKIKYVTSKFLRFADACHTEVTDHTYRNDLFSVMMYQRLTRSLPFLCTKRGYYTIDRVFLISQDILFEAEIVTSLEASVPLYVYPRPIERSRLLIPFQTMFGTILARRLLFEDPFEFKGIREYQSYDTMKSINWKASAKTGALMVNIQGHTASQQIIILLNLEMETLRKQDAILEESIRLTASLAAYFIEQGIPVSLNTNALDIVSRELLQTPAGSGSGHIRTINETLARIDDTQTPPPFIRVLGDELELSNPKDYIILISSYQREDLQSRLRHLSSKGIDFSWIVPFNQELPLSVNDDLLGSAIPWEIQ